MLHGTAKVVEVVDVTFRVDLLGKDAYVLGVVEGSGRWFLPSSSYG